MREEIRSVKFVGAIETGSDYLTKEDKEYLRDNPRTFRVYIDKRITEEFVVQAYTK